MPARNVLLGSISVRLIGVFAAMLLSASLHATTLTDYLRIRKSHGVSGPSSDQGLQTLIGQKTVEIKALVKGNIRCDDYVVLLVETPDNQTLDVRVANLPEWLSGTDISARLLVRASRDSAYGRLNSQLIAATSEQEIALHESKTVKSQPLVKPSSPRSADPTQSARKTVSARGKSWNLSASQALPYYVDFIQKRNPRLSRAQATEIAESLIGFSLRYGVDARLIVAMVLVESGFNPAATSRAGAMGLGQLMPGTAAGMGVGNAYDVQENLYGTVKLVRGHLEKYKAKTGDDFQSLVLSLAAYNAGSGAVKRHGGVPPYKETQSYVRKVIQVYRQLVGQ